MILVVSDATIVSGPGMGNLNWEDYFPMDCFSRESSWNQRGKYLVNLIIKIA